MLDKERTDAALRGLLRTADFMLIHGVPFNLDVTRNGTTDEVDAVALYYALAFPELLGRNGAGTLIPAAFAACCWPPSGPPMSHRRTTNCNDSSTGCNS